MDIASMAKIRHTKSDANEVCLSTVKKLRQPWRQGQLEEGTKRKAVAAAAAAEGPLDGQCIRRKELLKKKADYKSLF
ncbi:hypothetical protein V496_05830 [Pseudogymnoascus sp. VKM F-4515 (FW-2607)]|nr:hypothetical protein V496_05830 [Pseudogymnoascus sp. VKM F-4515 (FW-2607)]